MIASVDVDIDVAMVVGACAALVVAFALFLLVRRRGFGRLAVRLPGGASATLEGVVARLDVVGTKVDQINNAVNHQPDGFPTLVERVSALEAHGEWECDVFALIARHTGFALPPHPKDRHE